MFIVTYTAAALSGIFLTAAAVILFLKKGQGLATILAAYLFSEAVWIGGNAAADLSQTRYELVFTSGIAFIGGAAGLFCMLLFIDLLIDKKLPPVWRLLLFLLPNLAVSLFAFSSYAIGNVHFPLNEPAQIEPGIVYNISFGILIAGFIYASIRLFKAILHTYGTERMQMLYVILGLLLTVAGEIIFDVLLPLSGELRFYTLGPVTSILFAITCGYAIFRHRLLDIRIVVQKSAIYTLLLGIIIGSYYITLGVLWLIVGSESMLAAPLSAGIVMVLGIFTVPPLENFFKKSTDKIFFKDTYNYAEALQSLSECLDNSVEIDDVIDQCQRNLYRILKSRKISILPASTEHVPAQITIPIILEETPLGHIFLEEKLSGDAYTSEDIQLLETFSHQIAVSLGRAILYSHVKRHAAELEQKVIERTQELHKVQEGQKQIMLDVSHGLQTPLAIFQTKLEQLKQTIPNDPEIEQLEISLADLSNFIYNLLRLARLENHQEEVILAPLCLSCLLEEIIEEIETIATTHTISIRQSVTQDIFVRGDPKKIRDVLMNLASNAIKYMRPNGIKEILFSLKIDAGDVVLSVSDTGIGIPKQDIPHIFERFYRVQSSHRRIRGSGLGLAISKRVVEEHGGTLCAESTLGMGTKMTIYLPSISRPTDFST